MWSAKTQTTPKELRIPFQLQKLQMKKKLHLLSTWSKHLPQQCHDKGLLASSRGSIEKKMGAITLRYLKPKNSPTSKPPTEHTATHKLPSSDPNFQPTQQHSPNSWGSSLPPYGPSPCPRSAAGTCPPTTSCQTSLTPKKIPQKTLSAITTQRHYTSFLASSHPNKAHHTAKPQSSCTKNTSLNITKRRKIIIQAAFTWMLNLNLKLFLTTESPFVPFGGRGNGQNPDWNRRMKFVLQDEKEYRLIRRRMSEVQEDKVFGEHIVWVFNSLALRLINSSFC
jgi:hypothetical protein